MVKIIAGEIVADDDPRLQQRAAPPAARGGRPPLPRGGLSGPPAPAPADYGMGMFPMGGGGGPFSGFDRSAPPVKVLAAADGGPLPDLAFFGIRVPSLKLLLMLGVAMFMGWRAVMLGLMISTAWRAGAFAALGLGGGPQAASMPPPHGAAAAGAGGPRGPPGMAAGGGRGGGGGGFGAAAGGAEALGVGAGGKVFAGRSYKLSRD